MYTMDKKCSLFEIMNLIGKKWTLMIILEIYKGVGWKRFNYLKKKIPNITSKILSERLKELEQSKIISRRVREDEAPICVEYKLTKRGDRFIEVIKEMKYWACELNSKKSCCNKDCKNCEI